MFGGSDPNVPKLVSTGITIRHNTISRPMAWITQGWTVKNLLEFKNAQDVMVEGNIIENHWVGGQQGSAIVLTPRNQSNTAPWTVVRNITPQNNVIRHVSSGFNILGYDTSRSGNAYRTDGVDIKASTDPGGGYLVGWTTAGEWMKYSVQAPAAGTFAIDVRVASSGAGGAFHIEIDGVNVTGAMTAPDTGGWQTYTTITKTGVAVTAGPRIVRLMMDAVGASGSVANFNWIAFR